MISWLCALTVLVLSADEAMPPRVATGSEAPSWYQDHIAYMTRDGGRWQTSNAEYQNESEPFASYVIIFTPVFGGTGMTGRLFGVSDGSETGDFWQFREYWDPARDTAFLEQFGWGGAIGIGPLMQADDHLLAVQEFRAPGSDPYTEKHEFLIVGEDTHVTPTYRVGDDGELVPGRSYVWVRSH